MVTAEVVRRMAGALGEVEETVHFRQKLPSFRVRGKAFGGLVDGGSGLVVTVTREEAAAAVTADPAIYREEWRPTNPRTFLGLRVELSAVSEERVRELLEHAWKLKAPKRLSS
jgi:hypothetical protein